MKGQSFVCIATVIVAGMLASGCAATPRASFVTAADAYSTAMHAAADLRDAGLLTPAQVGAIEVAERTAYEALMAWAEALRWGWDDEARARAAYRAVDALLDLVIEAQSLETLHEEPDDPAQAGVGRTRSRSAGA